MKNALSIMIMVALLVAAISYATPYDDSDSPPFRSGFAIKTDALTGCQYLVRFFTSHPRIAADGRTHLGCREARP